MNFNLPASSIYPNSTFLRPLGAFEELLWLLDQQRFVHFVMAAQVNGRTTVADWRRALDLVQQRHPLFSVGIERNGENRPCFHEDGTNPIPIRVVQESNATQRWEFQAELELSIPFNPAQAPLVRAVLLHEERRAVCVITIHPSIADGRSVAFVIRDLLQALSGKSLARLPVPPSLEEILGLTSNNASYPGPDNEPPASGDQRPSAFVNEANTRPRVKTLALTTHLTSRLRERARQEETTVHGALSAAFALACWEIFEELNGSPIRVMSPIDTRRLLGLGEECAVRVATGTVPIEPCEATTFWDIARSATAGLTKARTLEAIRATRNGMQEILKPGLDAPKAAAIATQGFAHDILLTNLGNLGYEADFNELELQAVWGPAVTARLVDTHTIGVTTINGSLRLVQTTFAPAGSLLQCVEEFLISACATRKQVTVAQLSG
jgi:hypothetical protein